MFYLEHQLMQEAFCEWIGLSKDHATEDVNYLNGICDTVQRAYEALERGDSE